MSAPVAVPIGSAGAARLPGSDHLLYADSQTTHYVLARVHGAGT